MAIQSQQEYDQHILSLRVPHYSTLVMKLILIQSLSDVHTDMSTPDDKQLPKSQLSVRVVAVVLGIGLLLSNGGGI